MSAGVWKNIGLQINDRRSNLCRSRSKMGLAAPRSAVLCFAVLCRAELCRAVPCCALLCRAVPCCIVPCRAVLGCAMLCHDKQCHHPPVNLCIHLLRVRVQTPNYTLRIPVAMHLCIHRIHSIYNCVCLSDVVPYHIASCQSVSRSVVPSPDALPSVSFCPRHLCLVKPEGIRHVQEFPRRDSKPKKRLHENGAIPCVMLSLMCIITLFSRSLFLGLGSLRGNSGIIYAVSGQSAEPFPGSTQQPMLYSRGVTCLTLLV